MNHTNYKILFLGETYRADAQTWIHGIEVASGVKIETDEVAFSKSRIIRAVRFLSLIFKYALNQSRYNFDFVLAERSISYGLLSMFVNARVRIVAQQGATDLFPGKWYHRLYKGAIQKYVYRNADIIHAWGSNMAQHMKSVGVPSDKIVVLPKGIDLSIFQFVGLNHKPNSTFKLVVTRSLESYYGHSCIVMALKELVLMGFSIELHIVGSGSLEHQLRDLCKSMNLSSYVIFHGRLNASQLCEVLQYSHIYVSAPLTEGFSSSLMESMACGCLPVVSDLPANRALIQHGTNGYLFIPMDSASLVKSLVQAIEYFPQMSLAVDSNRRFVEAQANVKTNMALFWNRYLDILKRKTSSPS
ncbi:MAG: glycosyltransferase family 4 protein [Arcticibacter sp.]